MLTIFRIIFGPLLLLLGVWFYVYVVPTLSQKMQYEIEYGILGAYMGFFGGLMIFKGFVVSWEGIKVFYNKPIVNNN